MSPRIKKFPYRPVFSPQDVHVRVNDMETDMGMDMYTNINMNMNIFERYKFDSIGLLPGEYSDILLVLIRIL
jgi:hypothetical protein